MAKFKGLILDNDLVLVDSFSAMYEGFCEVCQKADRPRPSSLEFCQITKQPFIETFRDWGITLPEWKVWEIFAHRFSDIHLVTGYRGNERLLISLQQNNIPIAVVSAASEEIGIKKLQHLGLFTLIDLFEGGHENKASAIIRVCTSFILDPSEVVMVGDMISDMRDARAAGVYAVGLIGPFSTRDSLLAAGADEVAHNHQEFQARVAELLIDPP